MNNNPKIYIVFSRYANQANQYLIADNPYHEFSQFIGDAKLYTLRQAQKIVFTANKDLRRFNSLTSYGYFAR